MATVKRTVAGDVSTEIAQQHTRPYYLVKIEFTTATQYVSTAHATTFDSNAYVEGAVRVGSFNWNADGGQFGKIFLLNELNAASAIVLNNQIADTPVTIYKTYKTSGGNTTPVELVVGVLTASSITPKEVSLAFSTSGARTTRVPNEYHNQNNGFNHLVAEGTTLIWGGESFLLTKD